MVRSEVHHGELVALEVDVVGLGPHALDLHLCCHVEEAYDKICFEGFVAFGCGLYLRITCYLPLFKLEEQRISLFGIPQRLLVLAQRREDGAYIQKCRRN